jgi:predicted site-specific integrase-resolvase
MLKYGDPQPADTAVRMEDARERLIRVFRILLDWQCDRLRTRSKAPNTMATITIQAAVLYARVSSKDRL